MMGFYQFMSEYKCPFISFPINEQSYHHSLPSCIPGDKASLAVAGFGLHHAVALGRWISGDSAFTKDTFE